MAGYTRQSTFADGDTITAALFNNEYNQVLNAFSNTSGHKHDGTANEGPVIGLIGDAGVVTPLNKVLIDSTNDHIEFWVDVSSSSVQQLYIADGAIVPVTDSDVDLGTTSLRFKDTYTDTVTTTGNATIGGNLTVTGNATISGNLTFGDADTDSINLAAEIDSDIIPNTDGTYDLGSSTKEWQDLFIDGTANIDSLVADTADINGGTIDGATIATSDITVGSGKTLNVSAGTLTLADNQISGDKVEGGTIAATTITTLTSTTGNITTVNSTTTNATTVDSTNLEVTNLKAKDGTAAGSIADSTGVVTLGSSVLTTTDINGGTIDGVTIGGTTAGAVTFTDLSDGTITIAGFADEDNMVSDSATLLPTQQSVKAYVDSQVTAQDLDFAGDTGGALSIDLDSESLTIAGGTGLDTVGSGNTVTVAIDSTVATLTGTQTLTNKTLTTPIISSISNTGTLTLPTSTDTLVGRATTDTLTNKTLTSATLTSPVINTSVSGTAFLDDDTFGTATATTLASSESIKAYVDTTVAATNEVVEDTTPQLGGDLASNGNDILFADNDKAVFGAGSDLEIYSDGGSNNYVLSNNGALILRNLSDDKDIYLQSDDGAGGFTSYLHAKGSSGEVILKHYGSNKLTTTSTGIDVTGTATMDGLTVDVSSGGATVTAASFKNNGGGANTKARLDFFAATTRYAGIAGGYGASAPQMSFDISGTDVLAINSTGIDVTGTATMDGLTVDGDATIDGGSSANTVLTLDSSTANTYLKITDSNSTNGIFIGATTNDLNFYPNNVLSAKFAAGGDISFYEDTGTTQALFWDASTERLGIGDTSPAAKLEILDANGVGLRFGDITTTPSSQTAGYIGMSTVSYSGNNGDLVLIPRTSATSRILLMEGNVGIGTTSPDTIMEIVGTDPILTLRDSSTSGAASHATLRLAESGTSDTLNLHYDIELDETHLTFNFDNGSGTENERMRIDSSGNLLVGKTTTAIGTQGTLIKESGRIEIAKTSDTPLFLNRLSSDGEIAAFKKDGSTVGSIGVRYSNLYTGRGTSGLAFSNTGLDVHPFNPATLSDSDGAIDLGISSSRFKDLYLSGGAYLGGTGSANHLDDYEEGTWTPVYNTGYSSVSYLGQVGVYTKIGNMVELKFYLNVNSTTASGNLTITGLPFTSKSNSINNNVGIIHVQSNSGTLTTDSPICRMPVNSTTITVQTQGTGGVANMAGSELGNGVINGSIIYYV